MSKEKTKEDFPSWFPGDPYPLSLCSLKNDEDYAKAIPEPKKRTTIAWYLSGQAFRLALKMVNEALSKWFTTDKPLPDGDYGWRLKKDDKPDIYTFKNGKVFSYNDSSCPLAFEPLQKGEFCKIEFPD